MCGLIRNLMLQSGENGGMGRVAMPIGIAQMACMHTLFTTLPWILAWLICILYGRPVRQTLMLIYHEISICDSPHWMIWPGLLSDDFQRTTQNCHKFRCDNVYRLNCMSTRPVLKASPRLLFRYGYLLMFGCHFIAFKSDISPANFSNPRHFSVRLKIVRRPQSCLFCWYRRNILW